MSAPRIAILTVCVLLACAASGLAQATEVLIVTDTKHPVVAPAGTRIILLDSPEHLKTELSAGLPRDSEKAAQLVRERLKAGGPELQKRLQNAYQGVAEAWALGITKIPAVIVDRRYVIYGAADVSSAVARIQTYRRSHP